RQWSVPGDDYGRFMFRGGARPGRQHFVRATAANKGEGGTVVNRPYVRRGKVIPGVYQRCTWKCGAERCDKHRWQFEVERRAGYDGQRQRVTQGGFETAKEAADAKADTLARHRAGTLA